MQAVQSSRSSKSRRSTAIAASNATSAIDNVSMDITAHTSDDEMDEEVESSFLGIDTLQNVGINVTDINKLRDAGITTVGSIFQYPLKDLLAIRGFSETKVNKIRECASKLRSDIPVFVTGKEMRERRRRIIKITTGARSVDAILGGGKYFHRHILKQQLISFSYIHIYIIVPYIQV